MLIIIKNKEKRKNSIVNFNVKTSIEFFSGLRQRPWKGHALRIGLSPKSFFGIDQIILWQSLSHFACLATEMNKLVS